MEGANQLEEEKLMRGNLSIKKCSSFIFPIMVIVVGLVLMMGISTLVKSPEIECLLLLAIFIGFNFSLSFAFGMKDRFRDIISPIKIWHFFPGLLIGSIPIGVSYIWLANQGQLSPFKSVSIISSLLTLATVSWEELWFRGIPLDIGANRYSKFGAAIVFAAVFMLLHLLNPKIDLLHDGLQLFVAGYSLSLCYFVFDSLWAPIGMHFSNNYIQALFGNSTEPRTIFYITPLVIVALALSFFLFKKNTQPT